MVRKLFFALLFALSLQGDELLFEKVKSFVGEQTFEENKAYIEIIFSPPEEYYVNGRIDTVKVVQRLKEEGLLKLFFEKPQPFEITFSTNGQPLFFVKLMGDVLRSIGYYRYVTEESRLDSSEFLWKIRLTSEYATDPVVLRQELQKRGCDVLDIERDDALKWHYHIDMSRANLDLRRLSDGEEVTFVRSLDAHWLDVSGVKSVTIWSLKGNNWYPYIAFYDSSLRLLDVYKRDRRSRQVAVPLPKDAVYMKISDLYSLKNIKDGLRVYAQGVK